MSHEEAHPNGNGGGDVDEDPIDLVEMARRPKDAAAPDLTLGGYIARHDRTAAFEGPDGQPYTVAVDAEPDEEGDGWVAFLVFVRWAATGAGIMGHVESGDVARGDTEEGARAAALDLSLYEVKAALDEALSREL